MKNNLAVQSQPESLSNQSSAESGPFGELEPSTQELILTTRQVLLDKIERDTIRIPTLPEVATSVRDICSDDNATVKDVCAVIERSPGIAARVIKVANSPLFRGSKAVESLHLATARLGLRYTANYVTSVAMRQLYQPKNKTVEKLLRKSWEQTNLIAASAVLVKGLERHFSREQVTLAGLTHQIGVLPLLLHLESEETLVENIEFLPVILEKLHGDLGTLLLYRWDFPKEIADVPTLYNRPQRESSEACLADVITVAYAQCVDNEQLELSWLTAGEKTEAHERLGIKDPTDEEEQKQLIEHIEITAAAFGE